MAAPETHARRRGLGQRLVRILATAGPDDPAAQAVLREVATTHGAPLAVLWLLDESNGLLRFQDDWAAGDEAAELRTVSRRLTFAPGVGLPGVVLETVQPTWIEDIAAAQDFPRAEAALEGGLRSACAAPLVAAGGTAGVIELFHGPVRPASPDELEDLTMCGGQLAAYLGRLRMEDRLRAAEESSAAIVEAALDCIVTMDHRGRVLDFNPAAEATFGYERDAVIGERLADLIIPPDLRDAHHRALAEYVERGRATILGKRLELRAMRSDGSTFPVELAITRLGTRRPPVFAGFIRDTTDQRQLESEQARLLRDALSARARAEAAEVRIGSAREDVERANERLAFVARAGRTMAESMDWEATVSAVMRSAVPVIADWAAVSVLERRGVLRVVMVAPDEPAGEQAVTELLARHLPSAAALDDSPHVVRSGDPGGGRVAIARLETAAGLAGALTFGRGEQRPAFSAEDVALVTSIAARAALHLHNARLYAERSHVAQTLQASLRPRGLPAVPGAEVAGRFLPAGERHDVGGDFYDVFLEPDDAWTVVIGDVAGKGAEAAAVTALARHTLRTASMLREGPAASLRLLNQALCADAAEPTFCTVFDARVGPRDGGLDLRFSNGGHPAPLLLRADGTVDAIESGRGPIVGAFPVESFGEDSLRLERGELLLLYTDGVTEVRPTDVEFGERELRATVAALAGASPEEVVAAVSERALALQAGAQRDDIALVAIRAREEGAPAVS